MGRFASLVSVGCHSTVPSQGAFVKPEKLLAHLLVDRYGDFLLTDAIRPSMDLQIVPREGYRVGAYRDLKGGIDVPVIAAAVSRERLFDAFLSLLDPLGDVVNVVLETSHDKDSRKHRDLYREEIDMPVLQSHLCDFEDLLLHDGCTGIAVLAPHEPMEIQFDEHKLLMVYAHDLKPFERILKAAGVPRQKDLKLITEAAHLHSSHPNHLDMFEQLCYRLGVGEAAEHVIWPEN